MQGYQIAHTETYSIMSTPGADPDTAVKKKVLNYTKRNGTAPMRGQKLQKRERTKRPRYGATMRWTAGSQQRERVSDGIYQDTGLTFLR